MARTLSILALLVIGLLCTYTYTPADARTEELMRLQRFEDAIAHIQKQKMTPDLHYDLGRALYGLERFDEAAAEFKIAADSVQVIVRPGSLGTNLPARRNLWRNARIREAVSRLRARNSALEREQIATEVQQDLARLDEQPEFLDVKLQIGQLCENEAMEKEALDRLKAAFPDSAELREYAHELLVGVMVNRNLVEGRAGYAEIAALSEVTDVYAIAVSYLVALSCNPAAMAEGEKPLEKAEAAKALREREPKSIYAWAYWGTRLFYLGDFEAAIAFSEKGLEELKRWKQPDWHRDRRSWQGDVAALRAKMYLTLADSLVELGRHADALKAIEACLEAETAMDEYDPRSQLEAEHYNSGLSGYARHTYAKMLSKFGYKRKAVEQLCAAVKQLDKANTLPKAAEDLFKEITANPNADFAMVSAIFADAERFSDATSEYLEGEVPASRIAMCDVNRDGRDDILACSGKARLLIATDTGFKDWSVNWGIPEGSFQGGVFGDYTGDGHADLYLYGDSRMVLLENVDGKKFVDATEGSGIVPFELSTHSAAWGDFNGDGRMDLYICNRNTEFHKGHGLVPIWGHDQVFYNNGDGTFRDGTDGLDKSQSRYAGRGVAPVDYNRDGLLDLFVANYSLHPNMLYRNGGADGLRNHGFDTGVCGVATEFPVETYFGHTVGGCWADLDNNGAQDLVAINLAHPRVIELSDRSWVHMNYSRGSRTRFRSRRLIPYYETMSVPAAADIDGDGDIDLFITATYANRPSRLLRNMLAETGELEFEDISYAAGVLVTNGWGSVFADIDGDADPDLIVSANGKLQIFRNNSRRNFIRVRLSTSGTGYGAEITVDSEVGRRIYALTGAKGSGDQLPTEICAGIGNSASAENVEIKYGERVIVLGEVEAGKTVTVDFDLLAP